MATRPISVVILYTHPLLGEGLDRLLATEPGIVVTSVPADAHATAESALADIPDVVIVERSVPFEAGDLLRVAPDALFVSVGMDEGPAWSVRREEMPARPESLLRAIRGVRRDCGHPSGRQTARVP